MAQRLTQSLRSAQQLKQRQSLSMTPQLAKSIRLLAMSQADVDAFVADEAERNPFLHVSAPRTGTGARAVRPASHALADGRLEDVWERLAAPETLFDHLSRQIAASGAPAPVTAVAREIAADLDASGFLPDPDYLLRRFQKHPTPLAEAIALLRTLEPTGVGARNLSDCLALQLDARNRLDPAMEAILERLDLVAAGDLAGLRDASGLDDADLRDALAELRRLDPRPGAVFHRAVASSAPPDILLRTDERGAWLVELNPDALPRVLLDREYLARVEHSPLSPVDRTYVSEALSDANWLVRALDQRVRTLLKVSRTIVLLQDAFFAQGVSALAPLTMQAVAGQIDMHESTVSRAVMHKTMLTPRGLLPLRFFFSAAVGGTNGHEHSAVAVQDRIRTMVDREGTRVLSDEAIVENLRRDGIEIARRTVAKYRDALAIPSSIHRRRRLITTSVEPGRIAAASPV